jgi:hypothetical protein
MGSIKLYEGKAGTELPGSGTLIMIFTEGTVIGPRKKIEYFHQARYVPIKNCVKKIMDWESQGAKIVYLTSRRKSKHLEEVKKILVSNSFPGELLYFREGSEKYKDIAEAVKPDILIEDDCRSIGGKWQMTITYVNEEIKKGIKSIVVKEFAGIDHLPSDLGNLMKYNKNNILGGVSC